MASATSILINVGAATASAVRNIHDVNRALGDQMTAVDKTSGVMKKLGPSLKLGLAAGATAAAAGLFALADAAIEFGKAALEDQKSADILAGVLGNIPGITQAAIAANEQWISGMQLATHIADTDLRTAISQLALSTGDLGEAQRLAAIAADASVASGKEYNSVATAMAKAADGNTTALKKMFPWLDANKDGTLTYAEAVEGLGDKYEGTAEKAAEQDVWKTLAIVWDELKEALGQWILPLLKRFGDWFKDKQNQQKIQDIITKVGEFSKQLGEKLLPYLDQFLKYMGSEKFQQDMKKVADQIGKVASAAGALFGALSDVINLVNRLPGNWLLKKFGLIPDFSSATSSFSASSVPSVSSTAAPTSTTVIVNWYGTGTIGDMEARRIKRLLEADDIRQGRNRGAALAVAW